MLNPRAVVLAPSSFLETANAREEPVGGGRPRAGSSPRVADGVWFFSPLGLFERRSRSSECLRSIAASGEPGLSGPSDFARGEVGTPRRSRDGDGGGEGASEDGVAAAAAAAASAAAAPDEKAAAAAAAASREPVRLVPVAGSVCVGFEPRRVLAGVRFRTLGWLRGAAPDAEGEDAGDDAGSPGAFVF